MDSVNPIASMTDTRSFRPGGRGYRSGRCERCGLHPKACVCSALPQVENDTAIHLVVHWRELAKPSSTARLASAMLTQCNLLIRGGPNPEAGRRVESDLAALDPMSTWLLYPDADAEPIEGLVENIGVAERPTALVVPDGTWSQTRRLIRRYAALGQLRRVRLPARDTLYLLRRGRSPGLLCTIEAIALALSAIEGASVGEPLLQGFRDWQTKALQVRGSLIESTPEET